MPQDDNVVPFAGAVPVNIPDEKPLIQLEPGDRPDITLRAIDALEKAKTPFYRRDTALVYVAKIPAKASDGSEIMIPGVKPVALHHLLHELDKAVRFEKYDNRIKGSNKWKVVDAPEDIARRILAIPNEWKFPPLMGLIATQSLRPDGSLLDKPGYDPQTGYILFDPPEMPPIPEAPSREEAKACLEGLEYLLEEFPIVGEVSKSVALSELMTPVLRAALGGAVPLHTNTAPQSGSGKSYLMDLLAMIANGERCAVISFGRNEEEENEKRLHSAALSGQSIIAIDNCNGPLRGGAFLPQLIERPRLQIRKLGGNDQPTIPNYFSVFANGNNIEIEADLMRRHLRCGMDANVQDPYRRRFKRDPVAIVMAERGLYVMAILTIARAYLAAGTPDLPPPFMSFGPWSRLVRGSLMWLGCADPVDSVEMLAMNDVDSEIRIAVFEALANLPEIFEEGYSLTALIAKAKARDQHCKLIDDLLHAALLRVARDKNGDLDEGKFGYWLRRNRDRKVDNWKLVKRDGRHAKWALRA